MQVINKHSARVAGLEPGEAAEVNAENATVKVMLDAGLLVDVEVEQRRLAATLGPSPEEQQLRARVAELEALLEAQASAKPAKPAKATAKAEG